VKAPSNQALDRFNRSYEYDGLGDGYARFLLDELLPEVETKTTPDGRAIKLSKDGNDRSIGGSRHRGLLALPPPPGTARRLSARLQRHRHLRGVAGRQQLPDAPPQVRAEAVAGLPARRQRRSQHLRRRLVDGEPGDGALAEIRRLRGEPRVGYRRPQQP